MIKENFQIGDWFLADGKEKQFVYTDWSPVDFGYSIDSYEPIPITTDILERNGFKKGGYTNLSPDYYFRTKEDAEKARELIKNCLTQFHENNK